MIIHNVLFVADSPFNLISSSKLQRAGCPLGYSNAPDPLGIEIGQNGIFAPLQPCDLYYVDVDTSAIEEQKLPSVALHTYNQEALQYWHELTGHMGTQNVQRLPDIVDGIDLFNPPDVSDDCQCVTCAETRMKLLPSKGHIKPGEYQDELIHSDLIGPVEGYMICTFTEDKTKYVEAFAIPDKSCSTVLVAFERYRAKHNNPDRPIRRLHTDDDKAYSGHLFTEYRQIHGIMWEPTIPSNPQMNPVSERMGQTLTTRAHAIWRESGLSKKMLPETINAVVFLRNRCPVAGMDVSPHEAMGYGRPNLRWIKRIGRVGMCQERKLPGDNWTKWEVRAKRGRLVGFEGNHFYRMLMPSGKVLRFNHVEWLPDEKKRQADEPDNPAQLSVPRQGGEFQGLEGPSPPKRIRLDTDSSAITASEIDEFINSESQGPTPPARYCHRLVKGISLPDNSGAAQGHQSLKKELIASPAP